jgi:hypothetical protein
MYKVFVRHLQVQAATQHDCNVRPLCSPARLLPVQYLFELGASFPILVSYWQVASEVAHILPAHCRQALPCSSCRQQPHLQAHLALLPPQQQQDMHLVLSLALQLCCQAKLMQQQVRVKVLLKVLLLAWCLQLAQGCSRVQGTRQAAAQAGVGAGEEAGAGI